MPVDLRRYHGVGDEVQGVGGAGVLRDRGVVVVDLARVIIEHHVLYYGAKLDRVKDLRLLLPRQIDGLCVAASLDVEYASVCPHVFVVPDQVAVWICGQGCFSRSRESEEEADVSVFPHVAARVQRQLSLLRHRVHHQGQDPLLHLAGVLRPQNHHLLAPEVHAHGGAAAHALGVPVRREAARVVDDEIRTPKLLLVVRHHQHVLHEQSVVRPRGDHTHLDAVLGVPTGVRVHHVDLLQRVQIIHRALAVDQKRLVVQLDVHLPPPHLVCEGPPAHGFVDDALVGRRAPRLGAAGDYERARARDVAAFLRAERLLVQLRRGRVVQNFLHVQARLLRELLLEPLLCGKLPQVELVLLAHLQRARRALVVRQVRVDLLLQSLEEVLAGVDLGSAGAAHDAATTVPLAHLRNLRHLQSLSFCL
mmetsp:Transcript_19902/g.50188  ORF Transcript_19902/g.50188 Transcript_19902/m.50188 type:complete len:420 (-) Transcript_19902:154-1413(-)